MSDDYICRINGRFLEYSDGDGDEAYILPSEIVHIYQRHFFDDDSPDVIKVASFRTKGVAEKSFRTIVPFKIFVKTINNYFRYEAPQFKIEKEG